MPDPRTSEPRICPGRDCDTELRSDEFMCRACARRAAKAAAGLPGLLADLEDTIARLDRTGPSGGVGSGGESKLPINIGALAQRNHVSIIVTSAVEVGYYLDTFTLAGAVAAITADPNRLRTTIDGPDFARAIHKAVSDWRRAIDPNSDVVWVGRCSVCGADMHDDRSSESTRCRGCGTEYETPALLAYIDDAVRNAEYPIAQIREDVAAQTGMRVRPGTLRQWRRRMTLRTWCRIEDRAEICQVGEFMDLAKSLQPSDHHEATGL